MRGDSCSPVALEAQGSLVRRKCRCCKRLWRSLTAPGLPLLSVALAVGCSASGKRNQMTRQALGALLELQVQNTQ
jgi:hypothetical protein